MKPEELPKDLVALIEKIAQLPDEHRRHLMKEMDDITESIMRRRRILKLVQVSLEDIRLNMNYLMFDLDATRRERDVALKTQENK
jgi:HEAT repeat protein